MSDQWKPTSDKWPEPAMVLVSSYGLSYSHVKNTDNNLTYNIPSHYLRPMPPAITPEQQAVLDAAKKQESVGGSDSEDITVADYDAACRNTNIAVRAMLAAQQPPDPVKELRKAWNAKWEPNWNDRMEDAIAALEKEKKS